VRAPARISVKAPVFSMEKLRQVDVVLGPEMTSTGEVMGQDVTLPGALYRALVAAGVTIPAHRAVLASIADRDKAEAAPLILRFAELGYSVYATDETARFLEIHGMRAIRVSKNGSDPTALRLIHDHAVSVVVNTPTHGKIPGRAGFALRRAAFERHLPCFTSLDTASYRDNGVGYFLTTASMDWYRRQYLTDLSEASHPYASPLQAADLTGLPPALVITAEHDPLCDEGEAYAARLREAGVPATATRYDGVFHGFFALGTMLDAAKQASEEAYAALRDAFTR